MAVRSIPSVVEIMKGTNQMVRVAPVRAESGTLVGITLLRYHGDREEYREKGGFGLSTREARQLAGALERIANHIEHQEES